jgi:hypothetical protein
MQRNTNCHSLKLAGGYDGPHAHENYSTVVKTLSMNWDFSSDSTALDDDNVSYTIMFMTENSHQVEFQVSILGEILSQTVQVGHSADNILT